MTLIALMGATALWLTFLWLASCIVAGYLSDAQGLRREGRLGHRPVPVGDRDHRLAGLARQAGIQVEAARAGRPHPERGSRLTSLSGALAGGLRLRTVLVRRLPGSSGSAGRAGCRRAPRRPRERAPAGGSPAGRRCRGGSASSSRTPAARPARSRRAAGGGRGAPRGARPRAPSRASARDPGGPGRGANRPFLLPMMAARAPRCRLSLTLWCVMRRRRAAPRPDRGAGTCSRARACGAGPRAGPW